MGTASAQEPSIYGTARTEHGSSRVTRFALTKFRPPTLPVTLITRPVLHDRLTAGAGKRLTVQLVLAGRYDPPLWQHRLPMSCQLNEIRDRDLYCSLTESHYLLANFGVQISVLTWR